MLKSINACSSEEFHPMPYGRAAYVKAKYPGIHFPGLLVSVWKVSSRTGFHSTVSVCVLIDLKVNKKGIQIIIHKTEFIGITLDLSFRRTVRSCGHINFSSFTYRTSVRT